MKREISPAFRRYLMTRGEMTSKEIDSMTPNELFEEVLNLEGILYPVENIKRIVKDCYGIDLNHYEEHLGPGSLAYMDKEDKHD